MKRATAIIMALATITLCAYRGGMLTPCVLVIAFFALACSTWLACADHE